MVSEGAIGAFLLVLNQIQGKSSIVIDCNLCTPLQESH